MGLIPPLDTYDYLTFAALIFLAVALCAAAIYILGLPGKIAIQRRHPHAETVKLMGYVGFLAVIPWIHALIWAFHESITIDIRRFPKAEEKAIDEQIRRLTEQNGKESQPKQES